MLNLLPPEIKNRYQAGSRLYSLGLVYFVVLVALGLGALAIATYNFTQTTSIAQKQGEIDGLMAAKQKQTEITAKAAFIEDRLKVAATYQEKTEWEKLLNQVAEATPTGVQLTALRISNADGKGTALDISGKTADRRSIVLFSDRLSTKTTINGTNIQSIGEEKAQGSTAKTFTFTVTAGVKN